MQTLHGAASSDYAELSAKIGEKLERRRRDPRSWPSMTTPRSGRCDNGRTTSTTRSPTGPRSRPGDSVVFAGFPEAAARSQAGIVIIFELTERNVSALLAKLDDRVSMRMLRDGTAR
jgi:hypothetical protein